MLSVIVALWNVSCQDQVSIGCTTSELGQKFVNVSSIVQVEVA
jgi:hypothetical protein